LAPGGLRRRSWNTRDGDKTVIGRVFDNRYEVIRKLGSGGMADVYLAKDRLLGRQVALKILSAQYSNDREFVERFRREASAAASLNHPNIVQVYDKGEAEGTYYIAMEFLEGRSLKDIIVKYAPLSADLIVSVSRQIVEALRYVHRRDIIHRDIKPQNIIIDNEGRVKVTDFGIARAGGGTSLTEAGTSIGTAHYLSPEQAQGQPVEAASDLYSLGVVMYEMATGSLPFDADTSVGIAMRHVHDDPAPPRSLVPSIPENLEAVILRAMGKHPTERYLTAQAMLDDIWRVQEGRPVDVRPNSVDQGTKVYGTAGAAASAGEWTTQSRGRGSQPPRGPIEGEPLPEEYFGQDKGKKKNLMLWGAVAALLVALIVTAVSLYTWGGPGELGVVPDVVGLSLDKAKSDLSAAGFKVDAGEPRPSADVAEGLVGGQDPKAGMPMRKGETVTIYLSSGNGPVPLPNVVGLDRVTAVDKLEGVGLKVLVNEEPTADQAKINYVQRQDPVPDTIVQPGATVTIWVAVPNNIVLVPNLVGMSQAAAEAALTALGLVPQVTAVDSTLPGGTVLTQNPAAGTQVQAGSDVAIDVSNAPVQNMVTVPPVAQVGLTLTQAKALLAQFHLKVATPVEYYETPNTSWWDKVIQQDPVAGTIVPAGSTVTLTVGKAPTTTLPPTTLPPTTSPPETTAP
jgi:beta-lactam-binding protein with PASTA domain/predicted Ser/Thr protein kinase